MAGMIDLAALPLWVNTLIDGYGDRPAMGGALPTAFLIGAVIASLTLARAFSGANGRKRLSSIKVSALGPILQGIFALTIMFSGSYAVAATLSMLVTGSAIAPFIGGALVEGGGYGAIGIVTAVIAVISSFHFIRAGGKAGLVDPQAGPSSVTSG
ncbi:hypothetical protein [Rhizobium sp. L1K21]|uniref:hypothetical protein n=1 Tax=Rhizobium sp. L1K21 TaxID=2954933 RepID=UPI0020931E2B|nr:hypothetical protein [Rhizobium sp. L1K21]MCO6188434.1 hypothetical protein [Rhizobium sp. L1K21]